MNQIQPVPTLTGLPRGLQQDGAISIELDGGVPVLRASQAAQDRIEDLLQKQKNSSLTTDEEQELQQYEDVDDYLSYLNRLTRNLAATPPDTEQNRAA
jgi:hypothetical protein